MTWRIRKLSGVAIMVCGLAWIASSGQAWGQESDGSKESGGLSSELTQRLDALNKKLTKMKDLRAEFVKEKTTPLLREPLTSHGTARAVGGMIRWDTAKPHPSRTLVDAERVQIYFPEQKRVEVYPVKDRFGQFGAAPLPRIKKLADRFQIERISPTMLFSKKSQMPQALKKQDTKRYLALQLTPKQDKVSQLIKTTRVLLDTESAALLVLEMDQGGGEKIRYRFKDIETNIGIKPQTLKLDLPEDVEVTHPLGE